MGMFEGKRVVVTGANGFIGANMVRRLLREKAILHAFVRVGADRTRLLDVIDQITVHEVDMLDAASIAQVTDKVQPDGVMHFAGFSQSFGVVPTNDAVLRMNVLATVAFMDVMKQRMFDFFVNTGTFVETGPKDHAIREDDLLEPTEMYSISRIPAELYAQALGRTEGKPFVTIRIFNPYGPWVQNGRLISGMITNSFRDTEMTLTRQGFSRDFIYIDDLIELYVRAALNAKQYPGAVWNGGTGVTTTRDELLKIVELSTGKKLRIVWSDKVVSYDNAVWKADTTTIAAELGYVPHTALSEGIDQLVAWYRTHDNYWNV